MTYREILAFWFEEIEPAERIIDEYNPVNRLQGYSPAQQPVLFVSHRNVAPIEDYLQAIRFYYHLIRQSMQD